MTAFLLLFVILVGCREEEIPTPTPEENFEEFEYPQATVRIICELQYECNKQILADWVNVSLPEEFEGDVAIALSISEEVDIAAVQFFESGFIALFSGNLPREEIVRLTATYLREYLRLKGHQEADIQTPPMFLLESESA